MAKHDAQHLAATYAMAERFVDRALRHDDSLFTPGRAVWARTYFEELDRLYVQAPDPGQGTFEQKLKAQIGGGSADAIQLMAEMLFVYYLPASGGSVTGDTKRDRIREILSWAPVPVEIPDELAQVLDHGIGGGGVGFHTYKWASVSYFVRFGHLWKQLSDEERERALADPWAFMAVADRVPTEGGGTYAREALLHLVHPDTFERIFSRGEKWNVSNRFDPLVTDKGADTDRRIAEIRTRLGQRFGADFDFYSTTPVMSMWKPSENRWGAFLYWGRRFRELLNFDAEERDYKLALVELLTPARQALLANQDDWLDLLSKALKSRHNNLTDWRQHDTFLKWASAEPDAAREAVAAIWQEADPAEALSQFLSRTPKTAIATPGNRVSIGSVLLMAVDPYRHPPYRPVPIQLALKLTDFGAPETEEVARYRQTLAFFDAVLQRAEGEGLQLRDRLDAQSVAWCVSTWEPPADWPEEDRIAFLRYRESAGAPPEEVEEPSSVIPPGPVGQAATGQALTILADELLIDEEDLVEIAQLLETKRQLVFYGPPGTGKTFVAKRLAESLAGDTSRVRLVQFHPSYAYEDFVEGYRPRLIDGQASFELVPGPLRRLAAEAASDPAHLHILIIDEMNRGNVAKVLGELYFLLEYRDEFIELQYSPERFAMPGNLRIIGTMNTADRSIALLDAALRRRFAFIPFFPDRPPIAGLLRRWLQRHQPAMAWVADVVDAANERLADRNGAIGPSFFLVSELDEARLGLIWKHEIMPYLEDHFFDDPGRLADFALAKLTGDRVEPVSSAQPPEGGSEVDADSAD